MMRAIEAMRYNHYWMSLLTIVGRAQYTIDLLLTLFYP